MLPVQDVPLKSSGTSAASVGARLIEAVRGCGLRPKQTNEFCKRVEAWETALKVVKLPTEPSASLDFVECFVTRSVACNKDYRSAVLSVGLRDHTALAKIGDAYLRCFACRDLYKQKIPDELVQGHLSTLLSNKHLKEKAPDILQCYNISQACILVLDDPQVEPSYPDVLEAIIGYLYDRSRNFNDASHSRYLQEADRICSCIVNDKQLSPSTPHPTSP